MKRSTYNEIIESIIEHQKQFPITGVPSESDPDPYFTHSGCDICRQGGSDVWDIDCIPKESMDNKTFEPCEVAICGPCLSIIHNGDETGLDFSVTEEDEPNRYPIER